MEHGLGRAGIRLVWAWALMASIGACDCGGGDTVDPDLGPGGDAEVLADGGGDAEVQPDAGVDAGPGTCDVEDCDNGFDDDCDGLVEEGCSCIPGQTGACYPGPVDVAGVGACVMGTMDCVDVGEFGEWGECVGAVLPDAELCDVAGLDENCDGAVNEGCECDPADGAVACGSAVGACEEGTQACVGGRLQACEGATDPIAELCNGVDDDCDGSVDEALVRGCGSDVGACAPGTETCAAGTWGACTGGVRMAAESCNGLDDDCDGATDEALVRGCGSAVGACTAGSQSCDSGSWGECGGGTLPMVETCDGTDQDCDGVVDESLTRSCGSAVGACSAGTETCAAGSWETCLGAVDPGVESCATPGDEDCDGAVDEGCDCTDGTTRPCGSDVGACMAGSQLCSGGAWQACSGAVDPVAEICNRVDDDCDGMVDEMGICPTSPPAVTCGAGATGRVLSTVSVSASGSDPDGGAVTWSWTVVSRPVGSASTPTPANRASATFFMDAVGDYTLQACATDDEGETTCCQVMLTATPSGGIQVELSWDEPYGDVDLHLLNVTRTPPDGWWTTDDCYYANPTEDWGPVGAAANPSLDLDDTDGLGPENVTIDTDPAAGRYHVGVHYFCSEEMGPTDATVRVFCDGALIATYSGLTLDETDDWRTVASVDYPSCTGMSVATRTVGAATLPASYTSARHCEIPCSTTADCPDLHRCARVGGGGPPRNACVLDR